MFALVKDGVINISNLQKEFNDISFLEDAEDYCGNNPNVVRIHPTQVPNITPYQYLELANPVFDGTKWIAQYAIKEYSDERKSSILTDYSYSVRKLRDTKLAECDWTQGKDIPSNISSAWATYRQALRDVPSQSGFPFNVTWPTKP
jgi:hypothetical protein